MISADTSALVAGGMRAPAKPAQPVMVRVLRAFMLAGQRIDADAEIAIDKALAAELVSAGKAERLVDRAATPPVTEPTKPKKEATRAQQ